MEYSNTPDDSGLGESSRNESSSNSLYTPTTSLIASRKRKIFECQLLQPKGDKQTPSVDSIESSPWIKNPEILSSTLNDSITAAVENCKIDHHTFNYYLEQSSNNNNTEKECADSFLKQIKEPSTPEKSSIKRYCTTKTSPRVSPMLKLGSPERNEILYSNLPNLSRLSDNKRCSPAKKRLFPMRRQDPVDFFCVVKRCCHIIADIFTLLSDEDLYNCSKVSIRWKMEIRNNPRLNTRLQKFEMNRVLNKENNYSSPMSNVAATVQSKQSTPIDNVWKQLPEFQITKLLTENQHVQKCFCCSQPVAVVERNISQCTSPKCGAICCLKCNSISKMGAENFVDKCQQSILLIEKPSPKFSLLNSPKRIQNIEGTPAFLLDYSLNSSQTNNSSGYVTDNELSQSRLSQSELSHARRNSISSVKNKARADASRVLKTCNAIVSKPEKEWVPRHNIFPVIPLMKRKEEIIEPSSPPKVKDVAGSKKSKRRLKRLIL